MKNRLEIEEYLNVISHGIGIILSIIGGYFLFAKVDFASTFEIVSASIYSASLIILYTSSTLYHASIKSRRELLMQKCDHISIYLLIAGTYTPVCLISLSGSKGTLIFITVWSIALIGFIFKVFFTGKFVLLSTLLYLVMGWLIVFDMAYLSNEIADGGIKYLMYGGGAYTIGIIFYLLNKISYTHFIWHLFVLAGSAFHFWFIYKYVF